MSDTGIDAARVALLREIAREGRVDAAPRRRRTARWIGGSALAGGLAATALVVGLVMVPATAPTASAAQVLEQAAEIAIEGGDATAPAGKYLLIRSTAEWLRFWDADMPVSDGEGWMRFNNSSAADADAALVMSGSSSLYVPSDRAAEWVRVSEPSHLQAEIGKRADEALADAEADPALAEAEARSIERAWAGAYEHADGQDGEGTVTTYWDGRQVWSEMPTDDPRELVTWLRARVGEAADSAASDSSIVESLAEDPAFALAPAEVRAASLRALALLDGSHVESVRGDVTTIRFEWSTKWWTAWKDIDIDTARGLIVGVASSGAIGEREPSFDGLPAWESRQTFEVTVVDSAP